MTDHAHHGHGGGDYEREDFGPRTIFTFLIALGIFGFVVVFIVLGAFQALDQYTIAHMKPSSPLLEGKMDAYTRKMVEKDIMQFPAPRLDGGEKPFDYQAQRRKEDSILLAEHPAWNGATGDIQIPIDRAMALLATRGLPARAAGTTAAPAAPKPVKASPAAKAKGPVVGVMQ
jgi:hypothetical protein